MNKVGKAFVEKGVDSFGRKQVTLDGYPDVWVHELTTPELRHITKTITAEDAEDDKKSDAWIAINATCDGNGSRIWADADLEEVLRSVPRSVLSDLANAFNEINGLTEGAQEALAKNSEAITSDELGSN